MFSFMYSTVKVFHGIFFCIFFKAAVQNLVTKVTTVLDNLIVTPDAAELVRIFLMGFVLWTINAYTTTVLLYRM